MKGEHRLRRARLRDIAALVELETQFPTDRMRRGNMRHLLTRGNADVLVIEHVGMVIADIVVLYRANSRNARLYSLVVHPQHRGLGLARRLVEAAEAAARRRGCRAMFLEVRPDNRAAQELYEQHGYVESRKIEVFYEDGTTALQMRKPLSAVLTAAA